jgi:hypothetical protein
MSTDDGSGSITPEAHPETDCYLCRNETDSPRGVCSSCRFELEADR